MSNFSQPSMRTPVPNLSHGGKAVFTTPAIEELQREIALFLRAFNIDTKFQCAILNVSLLLGFFELCKLNLTINFITDNNYKTILFALLLHEREGKASQLRISIEKEEYEVHLRNGYIFQGTELIMPSSFKEFLRGILKKEGDAIEEKESKRALLAQSLSRQSQKKYRKKL